MMQQQPPPYDGTPSTSTPQTYQQTEGPLPPKAETTMLTGAPIQAAYGANPGHPSNSAGYATNPGYPQSIPIATTTTTRTVVQQQPPAVFVTPGIGFHEAPISLQCGICKMQIVTATEYNPGSLSWLACCGLAAMGCVLGCCLIPFCIDDMKDVTHTCPNCRAVLGIYRRL